MTNRFEEEDRRLGEEVDAYNAENDRFDRENAMLEYFLKKHRTEKPADVEIGVELTSAELHEAASQVMEDLAEDMETTKASTQKIVEEMKALMELNDALVSERKKEVFEFSRDAVVGAENPRAGGKRMAEKVLIHFEKKLTQKEAQIKKLDSKNLSLQQAIRKMEQQLKNKEQMGEVLNVIDFDQLKIENKQFLEKIEERNNELITLKLTTGNTVQVLNTLKKRLHKLTSESEWLQSEIVQRRDLLIKVEDDIARVIDEANSLQRSNQRAQRDQQTSDMPHVIEYVKQKLELDTLTKNVHNWDQKLRIAQGELRRQKRVLIELDN
eukprot:TRINITY_DN3128_c0_g1_i5.p1 TRINITY_DN3128_c0_g1~~TRINITY_DN3128_c0_g1_i5.p1  ORF type:complete len:325 (+),score=122.20 TRINITY_DN3128_c0_g1_i5:240-1214(+)